MVVKVKICNKKPAAVSPLLFAIWAATAITSVSEKVNSILIMNLVNLSCSIASLSLGTGEPLLTVTNWPAGLVHPYNISGLTLIHLLMSFPSTPYFLSLRCLYLASGVSLPVLVINPFL